MARLQEVLQVFGSFEGTEAAGDGDGGAEAAHVAAAAAETLAAAGAAADDEAAPMDEEGGEVLSEGSWGAYPPRSDPSSSARLSTATAATLATPSSWKMDQRTCSSVGKRE